MRHPYPLTLLHDGACPVCALEMDHLRARDTAGHLVFVDIAAPGFDATAYGSTPDALNAEIQGLWADGTVVRGMDTLRAAYAAVGIGWVLRPTGWGPVRPLFDLGYRVFARFRQPISRAAAPLVDTVRARRTLARLATCRDGMCARGASTEERS